MERAERPLANSPGILLEMVAEATVSRADALAPNDILFVGCRALSVIYEKVAGGANSERTGWASGETGPGWRGGAS